MTSQQQSSGAGGGPKRFRCRGQRECVCVCSSSRNDNCHRPAGTGTRSEWNKIGRTRYPGFTQTRAGISEVNWKKKKAIHGVGPDRIGPDMVGHNRRQAVAQTPTPPSDGRTAHGITNATGWLAGLLASRQRERWTHAHTFH